MNTIDRKYDAWHSHRRTEEDSVGPNLASVWHRLVLARLGNVRGRSVAEIGCGRGDFAIQMARLGARVTALDVSATALDVARSRADAAGVTVEWRQGDAQGSDLPSEAYDVVVSCECLEHVERPARMAAELFRLTAPGGRCLVTTPSYLNGMLIAWARHWLTGRPVDTGAGLQPRENFFLYPVVRRTLQKAGFRIIGTDGRLLPLLLLPRVNPARLRVDTLGVPWLDRLARPFFLHHVYDLMRPPRAG